MSITDDSEACTPQELLLNRLVSTSGLSEEAWRRVLGIGSRELLEQDHRVLLEQLVELVERATARHGDFATWVYAPIPGFAVRPIDFLRERRLTAFAGSIHCCATPIPEVSPAALRVWRRDQPWWPYPERDASWIDPASG